MTELSIASLKWEIRQRLTLLEATAFWTGELATHFLIKTFSISRVQATKDIALYLTFAPNNLRYDRSLKRYLITDEFKPLLIHGDPEECLQVLQNSSASPSVVTLMNNLPPVSILSSPIRLIDITVLQSVLQATRLGLMLNISYQSMSTPEPKNYSVSPHTLVFDGLRWHMRAFSHTHNQFRDFVLARIHQASLPAKATNKPPTDHLWEKWLTVKIGPHPGLSDAQQRVIERDYNMENGVYSTQVRAALLPYFLLTMRIGQDDWQRGAMAQQIVLLNRDELSAFIPFR